MVGSVVLRHSGLSPLFFGKFSNCVITGYSKNQTYSLQIINFFYSGHYLLMREAIKLT